MPLAVTTQRIATNRSRVGSLRDTLGAAWQENVPNLFDVIRFTADSCYEAPTLYDPCDDEMAKEVGDSVGTVTNPVFTVYAGSSCTTAADPATLELQVELARARMAVHLSNDVEIGLWDGRDGSNPGADTWFLASSGADDINSGVAVGLVTGISNMVEALDDVLGGARGIIHVPRALVPFLRFYGLVERTGNQLTVDGTDHLVVAGTGYSGSDPDGNVTVGEPWIYGTGPVGVAVSPVVDVNAVDWEINQFTAIAEHTAAAYFNPCAHIGLPVCTPDPGPECGAS